jgi:DNA-binding transcriptional LysR family regulator
MLSPDKQLRSSRILSSELIVGITVLPEVTVSEEIEQGKLIRLAWEEGELEVAILMIWRKEKWLSPTLAAFMEIVREALKGASSMGKALQD